MSGAALNFTEKGGIPEWRRKPRAGKRLARSAEPDSFRRGRLSPPDIPYAPSGRDRAELSGGQLNPVPHTHFSNHVSRLDAIDDFHARNNVSKHGVPRVEMRVR